MKTPFLLLALTSGIASADLLVYDGFDYPADDLTGAGGSGWTTAWEGANPVVVRTPGLGFTDVIGNVLTTTGSALNTADGSGTTTISGREVTDRNAETWISVLVQPQTSSSNFIGVSFYQNDLTQANARFAIENAGGKDLRLTRRVTPVANSASFATTIGTTVLAVMHLVPGGGSGGTPDRIDVYFNPTLDSLPASPSGSVQINGLQFDRVRIAGATGNSILVDELRIGESYADVVPFTPPADPDSDADGLTNAQEVALGLDPQVPDTAFIAAVKANPGLFNLHSTAQILERKVRGPRFNFYGTEDIEYGFDITKGSGDVVESVITPLPFTPTRKFLRLYLDETP